MSLNAAWESAVRFFNFLKQHMFPFPLCQKKFVYVTCALFIPKHSTVSSVSCSLPQLIVAMYRNRKRIPHTNCLCSLNLTPDGFIGLMRATCPVICGLLCATGHRIKQRASKDADRFVSVVMSTHTARHHLLAALAMDEQHKFTVR